MSTVASVKYATTRPTPVLSASRRSATRKRKRLPLTTGASRRVLDLQRARIEEGAVPDVRERHEVGPRLEVRVPDLLTERIELVALLHQDLAGRVAERFEDVVGQREELDVVLLAERADGARVDPVVLRQHVLVRRLACDGNDDLQVCRQLVELFL